MSLAVTFDRLSPQSAWWPRLAVAASGTLLAIVALQLAWLLLAGADVPPAPPPAPLPQRAQSATGAVSVARWHLFGQAVNTAPVALQVDAPATALQLELRGTLNESAPEGGVAIIADANGDERAYRVGDMLPGDARLEAIYAARVLLSRNGVRESLSLPRLDGTLPAATPLPGAPRSAPGSHPAVPPMPGAPGNAFVAPISVGAPAMDTLRATVNPNIAELAKQVSVIPVMENGRFAGVRLSVGRDSDLLQRSGLRSTDVITSVNGIPLDGPQRAEQLTTSLRDARQLNLSVVRDGKTIQLTVGL